MERYIAYSHACPRLELARLHQLLVSRPDSSRGSSLAPDHSLARDLTCARERVWHLESLFWVVIKQGMRNEEMRNGEMRK